MTEMSISKQESSSTVSAVREAELLFIKINQNQLPASRTAIPKKNWC